MLESFNMMTSFCALMCHNDGDDPPGFGPRNVPARDPWPPVAPSAGAATWDSSAPPSRHRRKGPRTLCGHYGPMWQAETEDLHSWRKTARRATPSTAAPGRPAR